MKMEHKVSPCSSGCPTQDHLSYGACLRAKRQMIGYCRSAYGADRTRQKLWDKELDLYRSARDAGIEPDGTGMAKVQFAMDQSEKHGMSYGRDFQVAPNGRGGYDAVSHKDMAAVTKELDKSNDMQVLKEVTGVR